MDIFSKGLEGIWAVLLAALMIYAALVLFTRMSGLRSFSKMSSFDFATTVAMGSIIASTIVASEPPIYQGITALAAIFILQYVAARARRSTKIGEKLFDNQPLLLMTDGRFIEENMETARITNEDVFSKLREANVFDLSEVRAVVLEATGDVSVLHSSDTGRVLDPVVLTGVRDREKFTPSLGSRLRPSTTCRILECGVG